MIGWSPRSAAWKGGGRSSEKRGASARCAPCSPFQGPKEEAQPHRERCELGRVAHQGTVEDLEPDTLISRPSKVGVAISSGTKGPRDRSAPSLLVRS